MSGDPQQRMFAVAKELLWRQRCIEIFPYDREEVLMSLLPPGMQDHLVNDEPAIQWQNLHSCVTKDRTVVVELGGQAGFAFWMKFDKPVVAPPNGGCFGMSHMNTHYHAVEHWWQKATQIHTDLQSHQVALWEFLQRADHPLLVEKYWPELLSFVDLDLLPSHLEPDMNKRRLMSMPGQEHCERIIETLTASTLLEPYRCDAWVDYEGE